MDNNIINKKTKISPILRPSAFVFGLILVIFSWYFTTWDNNFIKILQQKHSIAHLGQQDEYL